MNSLLKNELQVKYEVEEGLRGGRGEERKRGGEEEGEGRMGEGRMGEDWG